MGENYKTELSSVGVYLQLRLFELLRLRFSFIELNNLLHCYHNILTNYKSECHLKRLLFQKMLKRYGYRRFLHTRDLVQWNSLFNDRNSWVNRMCDWTLSVPPLFGNIAKHKFTTAEAVFKRMLKLCAFSRNSGKYRTKGNLSKGNIIPSWQTFLQGMALDANNLVTINTLYYSNAGMLITVFSSWRKRHFKYL